MRISCEICESSYSNLGHNYTICHECLDVLNKAMDKNGKCSECNGKMFNAGGTVGTKRGDENHVELITCEDCGKTVKKINCEIMKNNGN